MLGVVVVLVEVLVYWMHNHLDPMRKMCQWCNWKCMGKV